MTYEQLHRIRRRAQKRHHALKRARAMQQHALHCRVIADHAWLEHDRAEAEIYYRSAVFARRRAAQLNQEIEP